MATVVVSDTGSEVKVAVGDEVLVRLAENATTGYQWRLLDLPPEVEVVDDALELPGASAPGAGGTRVVVLRAVRPGRAPVVLVLTRPWGDGAPAGEFRFVVTVE